MQARRFVSISNRAIEPMISFYAVFLPNQYRLKFEAQSDIEPSGVHQGMRSALTEIHQVKQLSDNLQVGRI